MRHKLPDTPFQRLAALFVLLFVLVSFGGGYWSVVRAGPLYEEWDFRRQMQQELAVDRGRILAADESVLAETVFNEQGQAERIYSYPGLVHVTGHFTLLYGRTGLERAYDDFLGGSRGQVGLDIFDELVHETIVGADLVTTIQPSLQVVADQLLGDRAGAVVVMDAETGAILALASHPFYNPNTFDENAEQLVDNPAQPLLNRVTQGLYTPGSVFKVVTLGGVLDQGLSSPEERFENEDGIFIVNGFPIRDATDIPARNAPYDLAHALGWSSNVTFAQLGLRLGPDGLREIAQRFGFGESLPFSLPVEPSRLGPDTILLDEVGLASTAFGQGELLVTPLQMALVTDAIANEGVVMEPYLVQTVRTREGIPLLQQPPQPWRRVLNDDVAEQVKQAMIVSATDGFARAGAPPNIPIGGKTGTAQLGGLDEPHAWFIAFAPAEEPEIVVAVIVEQAGQGGDIAAPIARELIQAALTEEAAP